VSGAASAEAYAQLSVEVQLGSCIRGPDVWEDALSAGIDSSAPMLIVAAQVGLATVELIGPVDLQSDRSR
jgi:hypothetical protein